MASVSSASEISYVVCIATSFPHRCPAHSWIDNILFGYTHCTLVHNFSLLPPQLLFALQHLCFCSVESGDQQPGLSSIVIVTKCRFGVLINVTIASHSLKRRLVKGLVGEDPSEVIHVNPRDASFSLCSQSSLPDHFNINF